MEWSSALKEALEPFTKYNTSSRMEPEESQISDEVSPGVDSDFYDPGRLPEVPEFE